MTSFSAGVDRRWMARDARQREEIVAALARGEAARALVLALEHLREFPEDEVVRDAAERAEQLFDQRLD
jgi:hypothetical protein